MDYLAPFEGPFDPFSHAFIALTLIFHLSSGHLAIHTQNFAFSISCLQHAVDILINVNLQSSLIPLHTSIYAYVIVSASKTV